LQSVQTCVLTGPSTEWTVVMATGEEEEEEEKKGTRMA
jgi:hypothetical protein